MNDFYFREATIFDVDTKNLTCSLYYGDIRASEMSHGVRMPNIIGEGNAGVIVNLMKGTRVLAAYVGDNSKDSVIIVAVLPSFLQTEQDYNSLSSNLNDKNKGSLAYPRTLDSGDTYLSAHTGPYIWLKSNNSFHISSKNGNGIFLMRNEPTDSHNLFHLSNNHTTEGSGGRLNWGRVKRSFKNIGWNNQNEFYTDLHRDTELREVGFWGGERVSKLSTPIGSRNPALSEYRMVISEFATEFGFAGLDKEYGKISSRADSAGRAPTLLRDREPGNVFRLPEGDLIEIIGGNLIDINGVVLDINYNPVSYSLVAPASDPLKLEEAKLKSRRGVGYHFKLSTNINSNDVASSSKDFVFDIDKEGILKVNIPKSTSTGNIPYVSDINFEAKQDKRVHGITSLNPTAFEKIPVHTKNRNGNAVFSPPKPIRETGVRFVNADDTYFPTADAGGKTTVRVNTTKHHNIYAAAERLIANQITNIQAPFAWSKEETLSVAGISFSIPKVPDNKDDYSLNSVFEVVYDDKDSDTNNQTDIRNLFYSAVQVSSGAPAISTGGDTIVGGNVFLKDDEFQPILSNYFASDISSDGTVKNSTSALGSFKNVMPHGGVSSNINMEGSLELSVGADNADNKSIVLDTAGSLIAWLGKDKNNRSMILQSDGDVLFNIGGSYPATSDLETSPRMNTGRFDLRVNVVDKGFHEGTSNRKKDKSGYTDDKPNSSDYIISISEHGLVIAGMKSGAPMVIRNDGPLVLESASDKVVIKGMSVETVEFGKQPK